MAFSTVIPFSRAIPPILPKARIPRTSRGGSPDPPQDARKRENLWNKQGGSASIMGRAGD